MPPPATVAPTVLKITFKADSLPQLIERYGIDIGTGGIFIRMKDSIAVGTKVKFEFRLQNKELFLEGAGTVLWQRLPGESNPNPAPGMGVSFDSLSPKSRELITKIIATKTIDFDRFSQGLNNNQSKEIDISDSDNYHSKKTPKMFPEDDSAAIIDDPSVIFHSENKTPESSVPVPLEQKRIPPLIVYPTTAIMRNILNSFFPLDVDFNAFCMDYCRSTYDKFSDGMDRVSKTNILLATVDLNNLVIQLRDRFKHEKDKLLSINHHLASLDTEEKRQQAALQQRLRDLTIKRERWIALGQDSAELDQQMVALKRQLRQAPQLQCGEILNDRYELLEVIGKGGFARIWQVFDRRENRLVAAKILHSEASDEPRRIERFERGALRMKSLNHSHIVRVLDGPISHLGFRYFIMDYYPGGDLASAIIERRITQTNALRAIIDIGTALSYAHHQKVIHRDVKPQNILLDHHGQAFLSDFDLVWAANTTGGTKTGFMGSYLYAPPEQAEDAKSVDERADVYALGMTAIFVLYGKELSPRVLHQRGLFIDALPCSEAAKQVLRHATAVDAEDRPQTVAAFCRDLTAALAKR